MDASDILRSISSNISGASAGLEEQIQRLERAKNKIEQEQNAGLGEIKKLKQPELGKLWSGSRANHFQEDREEAYNTMSSILNNDYEGYMSAIGSRITFLKIEKATADFYAQAANKLSSVVAAGEHLADDIGNELNELKKRWL